MTNPPKLPPINTDGSIDILGPVGAADTLRWAAVAARQLTSYVRGVGVRAADGSLTVGKAGIDEFFQTLQMFAQMPQVHFIPRPTPEQQKQLDTVGIVGGPVLRGRQGIPHSVAAACLKMTFFKVEGDRTRFTEDELVQLEGLAAYVEAIASEYEETPGSERSRPMTKVEHLRSLASQFEAEKFDHGGLRLLMLVKPKGTAEDWVGHGVKWVQDPAAGLDEKGNPLGKRLEAWIASLPGDVPMRPLAHGLVEPASPWLVESGGLVQVRLFWFGELAGKDTFAPLAATAGLGLIQLPDGLQQQLQAEHINALSLANDPRTRWMLSLFSLAWRNPGKFGLRAWRGAVRPNGEPITLPLEKDRLKASIAGHRANETSGPMGSYFDRLPVPPDDYIAVVAGDVFTASAAACGLLGEEAHLSKQRPAIPAPAASSISPVSPSKPIKKPSDKAFAAWRVRQLMGITNQTEIAAKMTEMEMSTSQGQVSRYLSEVDAFLKAGGVMPALGEVAAPAVSVDPLDIEMGEEQHGRSRHQRHQKDDDE